MFVRVSVEVVIANCEQLVDKGSFDCLYLEIKRGQIIILNNIIPVNRFQIVMNERRSR